METFQGTHLGRALWRLVVLVVAVSSSTLTPKLLQFPLMQETSEWTQDDLRAIDPPQAVPPGVDLLAAYSRHREDDFQIRLDFLDLESGQEADLYLAFDLVQGGSARLPIASQSAIDWELLLVLPANALAASAPARPGAVQAYRARNQGYTQIPTDQLRARVIRDPGFDTLSLSLNPTALDLPLDQAWIEVISVPAGGNLAVDRMVFHPQHSARPLSLLLAFSTAYPAYTPRLALRRWDGAHTGPAGGRHGLYHLLRTARAVQLPIMLLDLKAPASLAGLDATGGLRMIRELQQQGLLALADPIPAIPAALPDWAIEDILERTRQTGRNFGLEDSALIFAPMDTLQPGASATITSWKGRPVIHLPAWPQTSPGTGEILSIDQRRRLASAAAAQQEAEIEPEIYLWYELLPASAWGEPAAARQAFRYLKAHPWIQFQGRMDLQTGAHLIWTNQGNAQMPIPPEAQTWLQTVLIGLQEAPDNPLRELAWDSFIAIWSPIYPMPVQLPELRLEALHAVEALLAGAAWAEIAADCPESGRFIHPNHSITSPDPGDEPCTLPADFHLDQPMLLGANMMAVFDPLDGTLSQLFALDPQGIPRQVVGPSNQLAAGLGESLFWQKKDGRLSDPADLPGLTTRPAMILPGYTYDRQEVTFSEGAQGQQTRLTYTMDNRSLRIQLEAATPGAMTLNLLLEPQIRLSPGAWQAYRLDMEKSGMQVNWLVAPGNPPSLGLSLDSNLALEASPFNTNQQLMLQAEEPNLEYPAGFALPIPMAQVSARHQGWLTWTIQILTP